jgi:hypothetical protein
LSIATANTEVTMGRRCTQFKKKYFLRKRTYLEANMDHGHWEIKAGT